MKASPNLTKDLNKLACTPIVSFRSPVNGFLKSDILSRDHVELLLTALAAVLFVCFYNASPVPIAIGAMGIAMLMPILIKKPEAFVFFLGVLLPFRDVHLISILHLKRLMIWSLLAYFLARHWTVSQHPTSRNIAIFTKIFAVFLVALTISLIKTVSELYSTTYITVAMVKTTILTDGLHVVEGLLLVYIIYYSMDTIRQIKTLALTMIGTSAIIAIFGILQYYLGSPPEMISFLFDLEAPFYGRATSVFSNPNMFGGFLAPTIACAFVAFVCGAVGRKKKWLVILPAMILNIVGLLLSFSRGAMLQVLFGMVVIGYLYYTKVSQKKLTWKVVALFVVIAGGILLVIQFYDVYMRARLSTYKEGEYQAVLQWIKTTSDFHRKNSALKALFTAAKHPIIGIGYNIFQGKTIAGAEYFGISVHNQYLKILVEMGLLGFIPFVMLLGVVTRTGFMVWHTRRPAPADRDTQIIMLLLLAGFSTGVFGYLFADSLTMLDVTGYLWIFSGAILALDRQLTRDA